MYFYEPKFIPEVICHQNRADNSFRKLGNKREIEKVKVVWIILFQSMSIIIINTVLMKGNNNEGNSNINNDNQIVMEPPLYFAEEHIWNVCFHPTADVIACSEITGQIEVLAYTSDDVKPLIQRKDVHKGSARYCTFNPTGNLLASCSEDRRLGFLDGNGDIAHIIKKAHPSPINRCKFLNDQVIISGDDDGLIKVWDLRTVSPVFQAQDQGEAITGIAFDNSISEYEIYTSCLNGTVAGYDLRQSSDSSSKLMCLSDSIDEELNGIEIIKNGSYIVCPSSQGSVIIFKREHLDHHIDRIQGHPGSVDSIIKIDENTLITGSEDGFLRGVSILPNKILQTLGQHEQEESFPVQSLSFSRCRRFVASSSHDNSIKFYDVNQFAKNRLRAEDCEEQIKMEPQLERFESQQSSALNWNAKDMQNSQDFESESDSSDQQSEEQTKKKKKKNKKVSLKARQKELKKDNVKSFFKGL